MKSIQEIAAMTTAAAVSALKTIVTSAGNGYKVGAKILDRLVRENAASAKPAKSLNALLRSLGGPEAVPGQMSACRVVFSALVAGSEILAEEAFDKAQGRDMMTGSAIVNLLTKDENVAILGEGFVIDALRKASGFIAQCDGAGSKSLKNLKAEITALLKGEAKAEGESEETPEETGPPTLEALETAVAGIITAIMKHENAEDRAGLAELLYAGSEAICRALPADVRAKFLAAVTGAAAAKAA